MMLSSKTQLGSRICSSRSRPHIAPALPSRRPGLLVRAQAAGGELRVFPHLFQSNVHRDAAFGFPVWACIALGASPGPL